MAVNPTIGMVRCPFTGDAGEVRRDRKGKLYYVSSAGMIRPNLPPGQDWILEHMKALNEPDESAPVQFGRRLVEKTEIKVKQPVQKTDPKPEPATVESQSQSDDDEDDWLPW